MKFLTGGKLMHTLKKFIHYYQPYKLVFFIDTNLQFIFEGIIILAAVTLDCLKYVQKK